MFFGVNFFNNMISLSLIKASESGWQSFSVFLTVVAVGIFAYSFWPMLLNTLKTRNTSGINPRMFLFHCLAGLFFGLGAFFTFLSKSLTFKSDVIGLIINMVLFTIHNFAVAAGLAKVLIMKKKHMSDAAHLGISESDHYRLYVLAEIEKEKQEKEALQQKQDLNKSE